MKAKKDSTQDDISKILHRSKKRRIFYIIYFEISMLKMWMNSIYRPDMPMDVTHAGTIAKSVLKSAKELEQWAQKLLDVLESEKTND